jgi:hypothetical protein
MRMKFATTSRRRVSHSRKNIKRNYAQQEFFYNALERRSVEIEMKKERI